MDLFTFVIVLIGLVALGVNIFTSIDNISSPGQIASVVISALGIGIVCYILVSNGIIVKASTLRTLTLRTESHTHKQIQTIICTCECTKGKKIL